MATNSSGITISILAKVEGWLAELKRIQAEAEKINLGTSLGKDLTRYLSTLEKQINNMGKNLTLNFTSDASIDRFGNRVEDIEERFLRIGQILSGIQLGDLNVEYVSALLQPLIDLVNLLLAQLNNELDVSWSNNIVNEATKILKAFTRIGKSEEDIKNLGREGTRSVLEEMVSSAIKLADEASEKIKNLLHNIAEFKKAELNWLPTAFAKETNIDSYVSSIVSKDPTSYGFLPIINETALEETKKKIEDSINEIKLSDAKKAEIQKYLNDLVPTNSVELIRKRIDLIKLVLLGVTGRAAFGLDAKSLDGYLNEIFNETDFSVIDTNLNKIKERFLADGITEEDLNKFWGSFSDAIKNQDFDKAIEIISTNLTTLQEEYKSGKDKIIASRQELEASLRLALSDQLRAAWTRTFGEEALKELDALIDKYTKASDTAKQLNKAQKDLDLKTGDLVLLPSNTGKDITRESSLRYQELISEIQAYKAELADVLAKELMIGKIQGVALRWFSIYAAVRLVENAIKSVISTVTELDNTITEIAIVTDMGQEELWKQMPLYTALALQYAASISGVYQVSLLYYQQGLDTVEVMELTELTLKMARISGLDYAQATDYMTNAIRSFKMEMSDALSIVDVYSAIAAASATDTTELASAMSKTASSALAVGSSFEDTTAMMAVMIEATRESAENIGSAMKSIISRYGEMTTDPSKLVDSEGEVMSLNRVDTALLTVGITIHDTEGKFRSFSDVIVELAEKWDTIDTNTQRYIATTMAGNRQQSRFLALVSSGDRLNELMTIADESEDASQLLYLKTLDSITAKTLQLLTSLLTLYTNTGVENWYKSLLDTANNVLATFNKMPKVFNLPIAAIANFGILFYNIASVVTTVVAIIKNDLVTLALQVQGLITEKTREASEEQIEITRSKVLALELIEQEGAERRANIAAGNTTAGTTKTIGFGKHTIDVSSLTYSKLSLAARAAGTALSLVAAGIKETTDTARYGKGAIELFAGGLTTIGYAMSKNVPMAIISGIMTVINVVDTIIETAEERAERLSKAAEEANNKRILSSANYKDLKSELDLIKELEKTYNDSAEAKAEYYEHTNAIAELYPMLVAAYDSEGNAIINLQKAYEELNRVRGEAKEDTLDSIVKSYEKAENAEHLAVLNRENAQLLKRGEVWGAHYTTESYADKEQNRFSISDVKAPSDIQSWVNEYTGMSLPDIATKMLETFGDTLSPSLSALLDELKNYNFDSIEKLFSSDEIKAGLSTSISAVSDDSIRESLQWVYDQISNNILEIGGIAEVGKAQAATAAKEAVKRQGIAYMTLQKFAEVTLEADFNGGVPVDYIKNFNAVGSVVNGFIEGTFDKAVENIKEGEVAPSYSEWIKSNEANEYYNNVLKEILAFWSLLSSEQLTSLNQLITQRGSMSADKFEKELLKYTGIADGETGWYKELLDYYTEAFDVEKLHASLEKRKESNANVEALDNVLAQYDDVILQATFGPDELIKVLNTYDAITSRINNKAISITQGAEIFDLYLKAFEGLDDEVQNILSEVDLFSFTSIMDAVHSLSDATKFDQTAVNPAITALRELSHRIPLNINTEAETLVAKVTEGLSDMESSIKHITKGMDYKTMTEEVLKLGLKTGDFLLKAGKYTPNNYAEVVNKMITDYNNLFTDLITETKLRHERALKSTNFADALDALGITLEQFKKELDNYSKYVQESGETAKGFIEWYFDSQIQTITNTSGQVKEYLTDVFAREALLGGLLESFATLAFGEEGKNIYDQYKDEILAAIGSGDISTLTSDAQSYLKLYEDLIISTYKDVLSSIANSMIGAIKGGTTNIQVTSSNLLALLQSDFIIKNEGQEFKIGDTALIDIEKVKSSLTQFRTWLVSIYNNESDLIKALLEYHEALYKNNTINNFTDLLKEGKVTYNDFTNYLVTNRKFSVAELASGRLESEALNYGLSLNAAGEYIVTDWTKNINLLSADLLLLTTTNSNATVQDINAAKAALDNAKASLLKAITSSIENIVKDTSNISGDMILSLADALGTSYQSIIDIIGISNLDGTYRLNAAGLSQLLNIEGISLATIETIEKSISSIGDIYLSNIKNATSYATKGASSLADVEAFRLSYADIVGSTLAASAFEYNTLTLSFVLDPAAMSNYVNALKKLLLGMGYTEEFVNAYIIDLTDKAIQAGIELDSFLNANTSKERSDEASKLILQIERLSNYTEIANSVMVSRYGQNWKNMLGRNADKIAEAQALTILHILESGGQAAVDLLKQIKPDASLEELEAAFNSLINKLNDVMSQVGDLVAGQFVGTESKLYQILRSVGAVNNNGIVEAGFDMVKVYAAIYNEMTNAIGKTTAGLNDVYARMWNATFADNNNIKEVMSSAGGMTMDAFKNILSQYEVEVKNVMDNNTDWGINWDAFGNIIINDIDKFMDGLLSSGKGFVAPQKDSYEYQELRRSWADAMVEIQNRPLEIIDEITNEITLLSLAKNEQSFNISTLLHALNKSDNEISALLAGYAVDIENGILTIHDASNVPGIMHTLAQEANKANIILTEDLQEIADAVSNLLQEIANIISNGISGKLSNVDAGKLTNWASEHGIDVDYTRTAEGLQLTAESAAQVYEEMKKIDPLLAKSLLPAIKDTKESYSTLTGTLMEFNDYNLLVTHKQDLANLKTLEHNLNEDKEQAWRLSNSKVKELYERAQLAASLGGGLVTISQSNRPKVISPDGGIMTYNSLSSGVKGGKEILVTPILPDGTVMSDNWAEEYASKMSAGEIELETKLVDENGKELDYQFKDIFMGAFDDVEAADKAAEAYHEYGAAVFEAAGAIDELTAKLKAMKNTLVDLISDHMLDPDSMNFMSNKLPDYWQGPVNMWENASLAMAALTEGGKKGYMGVQEFYNIITTASSLMEAAGQEFEVAGMNASELLLKGAENIKVVGGKAQIDLSGAGITVAGGVDLLKSNMADGVHELARAQIAILDAEIAVLEILAAMEKIGDLDVDMDGISFELGDIFANADDPFSDFTPGMTEWLGNLKAAIDASEGAKELLLNFKVNGKDMYSLLSSGAEEWRKAFGSNENIQKILKQFTNTDWDLTGDLQALVMDFLKNLDFGDFDTTFTYETPEMTIEFTPGGVKTIDWTTEDTQAVLNQIKEKFSGDETAARKAILDDIKAFSSGQAMETLTIELVAQINGKIKTVEGNTVFVDSDGNEISATDPRYAQALAEFAFELNGIDPTNAKVEEGFLTTNVTVGTNTNVKVKTKIGDEKGGIVWEYESADGIKGWGNTEAEMLDSYWKNYVDKFTGGEQNATKAILSNEAEKQRVLYLEFGLRAAIKASITGEDGKVLDPSTDPGLRQLMRDIADTISGEDALKLIQDGIVKNLGNGNLEVPIGKDGIKITVPGEAIDLDAKGNYDTAKLAEYIKTATGLDTIMAETISAGITDAFNKLPEIIGKVLDAIDKADTENLESTTTNIKNLASALSDLTKLTPDEFAEKLALLTEELNTLTSTSTLTTEALLALLEAITAVDEALAALTGESKKLDIDTSALEGKLAKLKQELAELNNLKNKNEKTAGESEGDGGKGDSGDNNEGGGSSASSAFSFENGNGPVNPNLESEILKIKTEYELPSNPIEPPAGEIPIPTKFEDPKNSLEPKDPIKLPVEAEGEVDAEGTATLTAELDKTEFTGTGTITWTGEPEKTHFDGTGNVNWSGTPDTGPFYANGYITWYSRGSYGGCFVAGTKISMADGTIKSIEDVLVNDIVISYDVQKGTFVPGKINKAYVHHNTPKLIRVTLSNGNILELTPGHPILSTTGWKSRDIENSLYEHNTIATLLNIGDSIIGHNGIIKVIAIEELVVPDNYDTYNAEVDTYHTFIANGIIAHNAKSVTATGNVGLAKAQGTLMGELGPELVVSNGRYFVAGQNGAEMVNLADDAIVFNHLQTELLLKKGMSSSRGRAVTNERNAVAFATGNINGGLAMASASAALAQLKKLRAMWEGLLNASISDLAGAGGGGGGGGGSSGDDDDIVDPSVWIGTVERWYDLTQQIARLEKEITYQELIRTKISSDWQKNGKAYYNSLKLSLKALEEEIKAQEELNISRQDYYKKRQAALKKSNFGKIYDFDDLGLLQFNHNANLKINGKTYTNSLEWYRDLIGFDDNKGANYTNKEKYDILVANGFESYMKFDENGEEIKMDSDNNGEITDEEREDYYEKATKAWKEKLDDYQETTQSLWDKILEGNETLEELETKRNEVLLEMRDNQLDIEDKVLSAIEDMKLREIDDMQDLRDGIEESTKEYIDGLSNALNKEKEMYETQESLAELSRKQRQLGILQRSGGSVTDIKSLLNEIESASRDLYFNLQLLQIDAIQEAADALIERLDTLIDLMTETLEYLKTYGLLWGEVYLVMAQDSAAITAFITGQDSSFWDASPLADELTVNKILFGADQWEAYRKDIEIIRDESFLQLRERDWKTFDEGMKKLYGNDYDKSGEYKKLFEKEYKGNSSLSMTTKVLSDKIEGDLYAALQQAAAAKAGAAYTNSGQYAYRKKDNEKHYKDVYELRNGSKTWTYLKTENENHSFSNGICSKCGLALPVLELSASSSWSPDNCADKCQGVCKGQLWNDTSKSSSSKKGKEVKYVHDVNYKGSSSKCSSGKPVASGGYVNHGLYELGERGTETVFTAQQTQVLRNNILSNRPSSLVSLLKTYNEGFSRMDTPLTGTTTEDNSTNIDKLEFSMNVQQISNDYDARRAGEQAMNEIMRIARKTSAANSIRR